MNGIVKNMSVSVKIRRLLIIAVAVFVWTIAAIFAIGCGNNNEESDSPSLDSETEITARDVSCDYDGKAHGIEITGLRSGDKVEYSTDGVTYVETVITYTEVGCYEIFYRVKRNGETVKSGKATVTIEKRILSGISCEDAEFEFDGQAHGIEIKGVRDGDKVRYSLDGISFSEEPVAVTEVGEYTVYYIVERGFEEYRDSCKITITARRVIITVDGVEVEVTGTTELDIDDVFKSVTYDGNEHCVEVDTTGLVCIKSGDGYTTTIPKHKEVGVYEYELVVVESGYLPTEIQGVLEIREQVYNVYYNASGVIVVTESGAKRNGITIDASKISETPRGVEYDGEEYVAEGDEKILEIRIGETSYVRVIEVDEYYLNKIGNEIVIKSIDGEEFFRTSVVGEIERAVFCGIDLSCIESCGYTLAENVLKANTQYFVLELSIA